MYQPPTDAYIQDLMTDHDLTLRDARRIAIKKKILDAIRSAETITHLKIVLIVMMDGDYL